MYRIQDWTVVLSLMIAAGCASAPPMPPAEGPAGRALEIRRVPDRVGDFRRIHIRRYPQRELGTAYRYSDGTPMRMDLFVYPVSRGVRGRGDSPRRQTQVEGHKLLETVDEGRRRGWFTSFEVVADSVVRVRFRARTLEGSHIAALISSEGTLQETHQYIFVVGSEFVKLRTTYDEGAVPLARIEQWLTEMLREMTAAPEPVVEGA